MKGQTLVEGVIGIIVAIILAYVFIAVLAPAFTAINPQSGWVFVIGAILIILSIIVAVLKLAGIDVGGAV